MKPLIEHGYLYIAQPPLYKAKIGKKEQYLKDERAFKQFLFDWALREYTSFLDDKTDTHRQEWTQTAYIGKNIYRLPSNKPHSALTWL